MYIRFSKLSTAIILAVLFVASCKKSNIDLPPPTTTTPKDSSYLVSEQFETGKKAAYAINDITLKTGSWSFNDALVGNTASDTKDSLWSVRLRNGNISTNFFIQGLKKVYVLSATYGNDAPSTLELQTSADGETYTTVGSSVAVNSKIFKVDSFEITGNIPVKIRIIKNGKERINIDNIVFMGASLNPGFAAIDTTTSPIDTTTTPSVVGRYVIPGSDAPPKFGDNSNLLFGNPSNADSVLTLPENYLIDQHYYIESYAASRAIPNWVAWHIDPTNITGVADRQDDFAPWAGLNSSWYKVQSGSYMGSGYDRGHNCPSADRTSSVAANSATFLMTNMIPQTPENNQQTWNNFEQYIRSQVDGGQEAYVIMGSYGNAGTIDNGRIVIPTQVWKVVVFIRNGSGDLDRVSAGSRVIAINTPNNKTVMADWKQYRTSVDAIEKETGYNLLSALPETIQNEIEARVDSL